MIEIRKHGNTIDNKKYLTVCHKCGCEFWFTKEDYKGDNGKGVSISCPECGHTWSGKYMGNIAWCALVDKIDTKTAEYK